MNLLWLNKRIYFLLITCFLTLKVTAQSPWKQLKSMNTSRNVFALVPFNGKLYALGGENSTLLKSVEVYDPQLNTWEYKADMPEPLSWSQGFEINGLIYLVCNQTYNFKWTKAIYAYNPTENSWIRKSDMPLCTDYMKAVKMNNHIYVLTKSSLICYHHETDKWDTICPLNPLRNNDVTCIGMGNRIYSIGLEAESFDLNTKAWTRLKPLPTPRTGIGLVELDNKIYSISGWIDDMTNWFSRDLECYNPISDEWSIKADLPASKTHLPAYAVLDGKIYYAGGLLNPVRYRDVLKSLFVYDPRLDTINNVTDYDGNIYNTVRIGTQVWMKENLRSDHYADGMEIKGDYHYNHSEELGKIYGKLYTWNAATRNDPKEKAQGVCPNGWHLPDSTEWIQLIDYLGGKNMAGEKLKSTSVLWQTTEKSTNISGFSSLPSGLMLGSSFTLLGSAAFYWSSSIMNSNSAWLYDVYYQSSGIEKDWSVKSNAVCVRCLKNKANPHEVSILNKETDHFILMYTQSEADHLEKIISTLETSYDTISKTFNFVIPEKIPVTVYPDITKFHEAIDWPDAPENVMAAGRILETGPQIDITYPEYFTKMGYDFYVVLGHELTHCITGVLFKKPVPAWLSEGVGEYISHVINNIEDSSTINTIKNDVLADQIPNLNQLSTLEMLHQHKGYAYPYSIIDFIVAKFGYPALNQFIRNTDDFIGPFGISEADFQEQWKQFLKENYTTTSVKRTNQNRDITCFPNPFQSSVTFHCILQNMGLVILTIHDSRGRLINRTTLKNQPSGPVQIEWSPPKNINNGLYFYTIQLDKKIRTGKLVKE